jgi:hypothetical protein
VHEEDPHREVGREEDRQRRPLDEVVDAEVVRARAIEPG